MNVIIVVYVDEINSLERIMSS